MFDPEDPTIPIEAGDVVSVLALSRRARYAAYDFETVLMFLGDKAQRTRQWPDPVELARMIRDHADHLSDVVNHLHSVARRIEQRRPRP